MSLRQLLVGWLDVVVCVSGCVRVCVCGVDVWLDVCGCVVVCGYTWLCVWLCVVCDVVCVVCDACVRCLVWWSCDGVRQMRA